VWLVNQDAEVQLNQMTQVVGTGGVTLFRPEFGLASAPNGTLLGRPIVPHEATSALGDLGDIILADLSTYLTLTKGGGMRFDVSPHIYFDQDATAYRFIMRIGGQSWWRSAFAGRDSNNPNTLGCFVTLAARAL
jgi:HK97 family phage major capsid protein